MLTIKSKPVLKQEYSNELNAMYVLVPIDTAANNFAIVCKKYYVTGILK